MTAPTDTPAVSEREGLIERLNKRAQITACEDPFLDGAEDAHKTLYGEAAAALSSAAAEVERLTKERDEAGHYTEAHERLDDLARERVAAAEAELTEALFHRDLARARLTQAEEERDELRLAICGGEDAPGHNASLSRAEVLKVLDDNYRTWMAATDRAYAAEASLSRLKADVLGVLEPFATVGRIIDGPFGPALFARDEAAFQSGCAWSENGETRTLTWGQFRAAAALHAKLKEAGSHDR